MRADYINPFIRSLNRVFQTMLNCPVHRGQVQLKTSNVPRHPVSGVIGLSGSALGTVVLSVSEPLATAAATTMLGYPVRTIDADLCDAIGELTNMVAGAAKAELEEYRLSVSLPNVITGADHSIRFPTNVIPLYVPFESKWGPLSLEVGLVEVGPAGAAAAAV